MFRAFGLRVTSWFTTRTPSLNCMNDVDRRIKFLTNSSLSTDSKLKLWVDSYRMNYGHRTANESSRTLLAPIKIQIFEPDVVEKFIKGGGPGGQKINKTNSCVFLEHVPTGIQIKCQKTRSLHLNRKEARRELTLRLDEHINGPLSKRHLQKEREQRRDRKRYQRSKLKYGERTPTEPNQDLGTSTNSSETS